MTPEELAHLRQWAEWGESPTPETTIALLDLMDTHIAAVRNASANYLRVLGENDLLTARLTAVRELSSRSYTYGLDEFGAFKRELRTALDVGEGAVLVSGGLWLKEAPECCCCEKDDSHGSQPEESLHEDTNDRHCCPHDKQGDD